MGQCYKDSLYVGRAEPQTQSEGKVKGINLRLLRWKSPASSGSFDGKKKASLNLYLQAANPNCLSGSTGVTEATARAKRQGSDCKLTYWHLQAVKKH